MVDHVGTHVKVKKSGRVSFTSVRSLGSSGFLIQQEDDGLWALVRNRPPGGFASTCGRVVCVHRCGSVHSPRRGVAPGFRVAYGWEDVGEGPGTSGTLVTASPSDRPSQSLLLCHGLGSASSRRSPCGLRHRGPAPSVRRPAAGATASLRSVRRATAATPTARRAAGPWPAAARCRPPRARHQRSPEGRLDHRDHQRAYRARCRVRDHTSPAGSRYARLHALDVSPAPAPEPNPLCGLWPGEPVADPGAVAPRRPEEGG